MYYICKFSGTWSLYDAEKFSSRLLEAGEIQLIKSLFPGLLGDNSKILTAIQINSIPPNKLLQLQDGGSPSGSKKAGEHGTKGQGNNLTEIPK